ncbi:MAG: Ger(x)C family spore germination protein [Bhargavaea sp.]
MKRLMFWVLPAVLLLSGCWDELVFRDIQVVTMAGIDGNQDEVTVYYGFPELLDSQPVPQSLESKGRTYSEARNMANERSDEVLDLSYLQVFLISEEAAKHRIYDFMDSFFRVPRNRVTGHMAIAQGDMKQYFDNPGSSGAPKNESETFGKKIDTFHKYSLSTMYDLQQVCTILFDDGMDLSLPVLKIEEQTGEPELAGTGLFSGMEYTGEVLSLDEGRLLAMLKKETGTILRLNYDVEVEGEKTPIQIEIISNKQKIKIKGEHVDIELRIKAEVEEFAHGAVYKNQKQMDRLGKELGKLVEEDVNKLIGKLQEAESDAIGIGRRVRAFHHDLWEKAKWSETYPSLEIDASVELKIERTGILE